ncbi:hypothetical protein MMC17_003681 [Xylographa soralifera]|nr:hypothetical protein [Xylographa soralifera]
MFARFSVLLVAGLVALSQATSHNNHAHLHHRRQTNGTSSAGDVLVTSTVYTTQEITITSCASTVTDCPAEESTHTTVTTVTVAAYTTICPVTMSLSPYSSPVVPVPGSLSSLISTAAATAAPTYGTAPIGTAPMPVSSGSVPSSSYAAGSASSTTAEVVPPNVPLSTGSPSSSTATDTDVFSTSTYVSDSTLTYTLGTGSSTTVVTTVIQVTSTETLYSTAYATSAAATSDNAAGSANLIEPTTTISSTSTQTIFITVQTAAASSINAALQDAATGLLGVATDVACATQETVTVTAQFTVTVTADAGAGSAPSSAPSSVSAVDEPVSLSAAPSFTSALTWGGNSTTTAGCGSTGFITMTSASAGPSNYRRGKYRRGI